MDTMMTDSEKLAEILKMVELYSARKTRSEENPEFSPSDDGSYDDAYWSGVDDGEVSMARSVLMIIKKGESTTIEV